MSRILYLRYTKRKREMKRAFVLRRVHAHNPSDYCYVSRLAAHSALYTYIPSERDERQLFVSHGRSPRTDVYTRT